MFLFFGFASVLVADTAMQIDLENKASTSPQIVRFLFIALGFSVSFAVNMWIFAKHSGATLNPAITLALAVINEISIGRAVVCFIGQIAGSLLGSGLVMLLFPAPLSLIRTKLHHGTSQVQGVFLEALMTAELVIVVLMLSRERYKRSIVAAMAVGFSVFIAHLIGIPFTGAGMNPVRSFAPCVVTRTFDADHWVYCKSHLLSGGYLETLVRFRLAQLC
jgi:aquaporin rerated protein, other eukaryote